ncbi:MAG: molybdate ABC transporter substrate-binding protein, partial [Brevibacterium aurantiacum]
MKYLSAACIVAVLSLTACSSGTESDSESGEKTTLTVFAAASLTEVFEDIAEDLTKTETGVDVKFSFAGSS